MASFHPPYLDFLTANGIYLRFGSTYHRIATPRFLFSSYCYLGTRSRSRSHRRQGEAVRCRACDGIYQRFDVTRRISIGCSSDSNRNSNNNNNNNNNNNRKNGSSNSNSRCGCYDYTAVDNVGEARVSDRGIPFASSRRTTCVLVTVGEAPVTSFPDLYTNLPSTAAAPRQLPLPFRFLPRFGSRERNPKPISSRQTGIGPLLPLSERVCFFFPFFRHGSILARGNLSMR